MDLSLWNADAAGATPEQIVERLFRNSERNVVMSTSFGADSAALLHLVSRAVPTIPVIFLDTGYLFPETHEYAKALRELLSLDVRVYRPAMEPAELEARYGQLWLGDEQALWRYNELTKVEPMHRALTELNAAAWISGVRRSQTEFREGLQVFESFPVRNTTGATHPIVKVHPILAWTDDELDAYLTRHHLPRHPLYAFGYRSIGDMHSTFPTEADEDARNGRNLGAKRECGIHLPGVDKRAAADDSKHQS